MYNVQPFIDESLGNRTELGISAYDVVIIAVLTADNCCPGTVVNMSHTFCWLSTHSLTCPLDTVGFFSSSFWFFDQS